MLKDLEKEKSLLKLTEKTKEKIRETKVYENEEKISTNKYENFLKKRRILSSSSNELENENAKKIKKKEDVRN